MALDPTKVLVGVTGALYFAPTGTALPTDETAALDAAFVEVGYLSPDGVKQAIGTNKTDIMAWQGSAVVRKIQTKHDVTYAFEMIETNAESLEQYYGNYAAAGVDLNGSQLPHQAMIIQVIDGTDVVRIVVADAQITDRGDVTYAATKEASYPVVVTAYPDAADLKANVYGAG